MNRSIVLASTLVAAAVITASACSKTPQADSEPTVERGRYIVNGVGGCVDCHTPFKMGPNGPEKDPAFHVAGHPAGMVLPPAPAAQGPWAITAAATLTAWSGPWGVSFTANLTPDVETGLGAWTEDEFVATLRKGLHRGRGRRILPPMPWEQYSTMTDQDLRSIFRYLKSVPAVKNDVPDPIPPAGAPPK
jgi:hypothetical protein